MRRGWQWRGCGRDQRCCGGGCGSDGIAAQGRQKRRFARDQHHPVRRQDSVSRGQQKAVRVKLVDRAKGRGWHLRLGGFVQGRGRDPQGQSVQRRRRGIHRGQKDLILVFDRRRARRQIGRNRGVRGRITKACRIGAGRSPIWNHHVRQAARGQVVRFDFGQVNRCGITFKTGQVRIGRIGAFSRQRPHIHRRTLGGILPALRYCHGFGQRRGHALGVLHIRQHFILDAGQAVGCYIRRHLRIVAHQEVA